MLDLLLAQMAREAVPGKAKTRMLPFLSAEEAADLHGALVLHTCENLVRSGLGPVDLWVTGDGATDLFQACAGLGIRQVRSQRGHDLGQRMAWACQASLSEADQVLLVGSDVPGIDCRYLAAASRALARHDAVIGPARDGGYVLLGLRNYDGSLFEGIQWGGKTVLGATLERIEKLGWQCALLPSLPDIDRPEDLGYLPPDLQFKR